MRYGVGLNTAKPIPEIIGQAKRYAAGGFSTLSSSHIFGYDAITLLTVVGQEVADVELMTAVVPIYTRHPLAMAQQALTAQAATGDRLALGIGLSHQVVVEGVYGQSYSRPLRAMREYLSALMPLVRREQANFKGETVAVSAGPIEIEAAAPPVIVAALGEAMLDLAGSEADGTATWMTGVETLRAHTVPLITAAAERAGRPAPRVVAALPVCVSDDAAAARERANQMFSIYGQLPSYRAMLDREGAEGPGDVALVGSEAEVTDRLERMGKSGVTDFTAAPFGAREEIERTVEMFEGLAAR
ncbi:MAG: TIGR03564 family F420-dependent LLM class oxidoreductase [Acidimicrobiales bacterium]